MSRLVSAAESRKTCATLIRMSDFERKAVELLGHLVYSHNWVQGDTKARAETLLHELGEIAQAGND